jgi:hypothetical protein
MPATATALLLLLRWCEWAELQGDATALLLVWGSMLCCVS